MHLMEGPQLGQSLTWDESAVAWANTVSLAASLGAGAPGTLRAISSEVRGWSIFAETAPRIEYANWGGEFLDDGMFGIQPPKANLRALTTEAHEMIGFKNKFVSTAVGAYANGSLGIASSDNSVPLLQAQWAEANGIRVVNGPGHAEMTLVNGGTAETGPLVSFEVSSPYGRQVVKGVPTNPNGAMCPECALGTREAGATTTSPVKSIPQK